MTLNTAELKRRYRAMCADKGVPVTKHGLRLFVAKCRALASINAKEKQGQLVTVADARRAGMPVAKAEEVKP